MQWFKKLIGKGTTHEEWLAANPGKGISTNMPEPLVSEADANATRTRMENELDEQRKKAAERQ